MLTKVNFPSGFDYLQPFGLLNGHNSFTVTKTSCNMLLMLANAFSSITVTNQTFIGASVSEPHTSLFYCNFSHIYIYYLAYVVLYIVDAVI